jgi:hypothetical protein
MVVRPHEPRARVGGRVEADGWPVSHVQRGRPGGRHELAVVKQGCCLSVARDLQFHADRRRPPERDLRRRAVDQRGGAAA